MKKTTTAKNIVSVLALVATLATASTALAFRLVDWGDGHCTVGNAYGTWVGTPPNRWCNVGNPAVRYYEDGTRNSSPVSGTGNTGNGGLGGYHVTGTTAAGKVQVAEGPTASYTAMYNYFVSVYPDIAKAAQAAK